LERYRWPTTPSLSPSFSLRRADARFAFLYARNDALRDPGHALFALFAGSATGCPASVPLSANLGLRACAIGELGVLSAAGIDVDQPLTSRRFWHALGASA